MAMAIQQAMNQNQQGDLAALAAAMTPGGVQGQGTQQAGQPVSGQTPNAKKPVDKQSINVPDEPNMPMSMDELIAGVKKLSGLQQRDNQYDIDVAKTVEWNAVLLNAVVSRVNNLEFKMATHQGNIDTHDVKSVNHTV